MNIDIDKLSDEEKIELLEREDCSLDIIEELLKDNNNIVRYNAAKYSNLFKKRLRELVSYNDIDIKKGIYFNNNADEEILDILSKDESFYVRTAVSLNENTSEDTLAGLYEEFPNIVIKHPNCPDCIKVLLR